MIFYNHILIALIGIVMLVLGLIAVFIPAEIIIEILEGD